MRNALFAYLVENPDLYLEEMVEYLWDDFGEPFTKSSVSRTLGSEGRLKNKFRHEAVEQNSDLVDYYLCYFAPCSAPCFSSI